jgi:hypothetical protein
VPKEEEVVIAALEEGSIQPKIREPLRHRYLRVEIEISLGNERVSRATC